MLIQEEANKPSRIAYSCYHSRSREGEQFVPEHVFSYQMAGKLTVNDGQRTYEIVEGDFRFSRRNQLIKFTKEPPANGVYKALSIYLDQETLRNISLEYGYVAEPHQNSAPIIVLKADSLYKGFMNSLLPYLQPEHRIDQKLQSLKLKEAVLTILQVNPELRHVLFDFSEPGKLDLEAFMNKNYRFNVHLQRFAYLTGRSLASFKRDFEKIFHTSPSRWLLQKRLQEAYYLIKEKGKAPSEVYLEVGIEDLSHFSFAFKKSFGIAPSRIN
ncbi:helix-turn-helix domain-containing protein [Spirosoma aerophilum]